MDGISSAASVIAVIQLSGSLVKLCGGYIQEVKDAQDEILSLQRSIEGIQGTFQDLQKSLQSDDGKTLPTVLRQKSPYTRPQQKYIFNTHTHYFFNTTNTTK